MDKLAIDGGKPVRETRLPLSKPWFGLEEVKSVTRVIKSGKVGGNGPFGRRCEERLCRLLGVRHALLTTSCTSALELALMSLGIRSADEVIVPSFSFVSTANAVVRQGTKIRFSDIEPYTFNIDPDGIERNITKRTRAIIVVHYGGQSVEMDKVLDIAKKHRLWVIEDAAHAIGAKYKGRYLGGIGHIGCISFHETKNLVCGEGGAFLTNDARIAARAEIIREKGTNRSRFLRGEVDKYTWVEIGSSYVISDILAAIILAQLKKINRINFLRRKNAEYLYSRLYKHRDKIILPLTGDKDRVTNWHLFAIRVRRNKRNQMIKALNAEGIGASFHFLPLHNSPFARKFLKGRRQCLPVTEEVSDSLIRLPLYAQMKKKDLDDIVKAVEKAVYYLL